MEGKNKKNKYKKLKKTFNKNILPRNFFLFFTLLCWYIPLLFYFQHVSPLAWIWLLINLSNFYLKQVSYVHWFTVSYSGSPTASDKFLVQGSRRQQSKQMYDQASKQSTTDWQAKKHIREQKCFKFLFKFRFRCS